MVPQPSPSSEPDEGQREEHRIQACGHRLLDAVGRANSDTNKLTGLYKRHASRKDVEFMEYMLSVIYVESRFDRNAHSNRDAMGLMQMTMPAVQDAVTHCNLRPVLDMKHLLDSATNIRYGSCYLKKILDEVDGDWTRALIIYNGGYKQLTKYNNGDTIVHETANYVLQVHRVLHEICRGHTGGSENVK